MPLDFPNALSCPDRWQAKLKPRTLLLALLVIACFIPRFIVALRIGSICPDGVMYITLATAWEEGRFRDALAGLNLNLYPPLLMLLHSVGLSWEAAGELWGLLISSLVVLPLFGLFRRQFDDTVALFSCLLYAAHNVFLQWSPELIRDPTFWFLFTATLYFQWRAVTEMQWSHFIVAGITLTLAVFTRFEGLFTLIPLVFWTFWHYRALTEKPLRRRLIAGVMIAVVAFPAAIVLVNMVWFSSHSAWVLTHLSPLSLIERWWNGVMFSAAPPPGTPAELQNITFLRLVEIYVPTLVKGLSPLFAIPMLIGMWKARRVWARRDHQPLFCTALLVMGAAWVHAWCAHESCDRYFLPLVLMGSPFAALGLMTICRWLLVLFERFHVSAAWCRLAVATPVLVVMIGGPAIALADYDKSRRAEVELAHWVQTEYGPTPKIFGSEGVTPVIAYYSRSNYTALMKAMTDEMVLDTAREIEPDVILILALRRKNLQETRRLINEICEKGFREIPRDQLPPDLNDVLVVLGRKKP